jgi:hypothetical protein
MEQFITWYCRLGGTNKKRFPTKLRSLRSRSSNWYRRSSAHACRRRLPVWVNQKRPLRLR